MSQKKMLREKGRIDYEKLARDGFSAAMDCAAEGLLICSTSARKIYREADSLRR